MIISKETSYSLPELISHPLQETRLIHLYVYYNRHEIIIRLRCRLFPNFISDLSFFLVLNLFERQNAIQEDSDYFQNATSKLHSSSGIAVITRFYFIQCVQVCTS